MKIWEPCLFACNFCTESEQIAVSQFSLKLPLILMQSGGTCECQAPSTLKTRDLRALAFSGGHKCWGDICVDKILSGRIWRLDFIVVESQGNKTGEVPTNFFSFRRSSVSSQMQVDQKLDPWAEAEKVCNETPSREKLRPGHFFFASLCTDSHGISMRSVHILI